MLAVGMVVVVVVTLLLVLLLVLLLGMVMMQGVACWRTCSAGTGTRHG